MASDDDDYTRSLRAYREELPGSTLSYPIAKEHTLARLESDLDAANARIAELEREKAQVIRERDAAWQALAGLELLRPQPAPAKEEP